MRAIAGAIQDRCRNQHGRAVFGHDDTLRRLAVPDRITKRVPGCQAVGIQHPELQVLVLDRIESLAPDEAGIGVEIRHQLESGGLDRRLAHVVFDEIGRLARHEVVGFEPVAPVRTECLQLRQFAVDGPRDALHVGAGQVRFERLEAGQDDCALNGVVRDAVGREQPAEQQDDF